MKKIYSLLIATFFLLVACEKDEIQMWDSGNYVQFMEEYKDSLTYSFFFYGTQEEIKVPLNIRLIGLPLANDAYVSLRVNKELIRMNWRMRWFFGKMFWKKLDIFC